MASRILRVSNYPTLIVPTRRNPRKVVGLFAFAVLPAILLACSSGSGTTGGTGGGNGGTSNTSTSSSSTGSTSTSSSSGTGGQCHGQSDCPSPDGCWPPGVSQGCGSCMVPPTTCESDTDCTGQSPTDICTVAPCTCMDKASCRPGCTMDAMCPVGDTCSPSHHCQAKPCSSASDCPLNFACAGDGAPACLRKACTSDAMCAGYCVDGACYDMLGTCKPAVY